MADWIERYTYDVVRRLPEKDREDVGRELRANIYDMMPENAGEEEIKAVLTGLGPPAELAEQYRQKPQYLISPAVYDDYIRALKWIIPLVGGILLAVGAVFGAIEAIEAIEESAVASAVNFAASIFSNAISFGVSGAFQALVWTTVGFVIADRAKASKEPAADAWALDQLPTTLPSSKGKIPLSDSIAELAVTVVFGTIAVLLCLGFSPFAFALQMGEVRIVHLFSESFLALCVPVVVLGCLCGVAECVVKIVKRRWTPLVCGVVVADSLIGIGLLLYLVTRPVIFSPELTAFLQTSGFWQDDLLRFFGRAPEHPILFLFAAIVIIASLAECGSAIYRTAKAGRLSKGPV